MITIKPKPTTSTAKSGRIVIEIDPFPYRRNYPTTKELSAALDKVRKEILRHVDIERDDISIQITECCEFCGSDWEVDEEDNLPMCCADAQSKWMPKP